MRFDKNKKEAIQRYLLEKIEEGAPNLIQLVCENLNISANTVHTYLKQLREDGVIERRKRGSYQLVTRLTEYHFSRSKGEIEEEQRIYDENLRPHFMELPKNVKGIWDYILGEMINNVIDHSSAENLEILVFQNYIATKVFILDDGIGIFKKIQEHFQMYSLDEAICELFKGKLTTDPKNHSGEGIFFSSKLADRFMIFSDGKIFSTDKYEDDFLVGTPEKVVGTLVAVELSNMSNKQPAEIFNQYSEVDGGFTKTKIPLKNIFDSAPVSRSQAKRVCQRLENFQEVILDFDGLEWMGQGFAHQIFILFQEEHPNIALRPINMSESVSEMYAHVTKRSYS